MTNEFTNETQEQSTARIIAAAATATAKAVAEAAQAAAAIIAKENFTALTAIAVLQSEVTTLKNQQTSFEAEINKRLDGFTPLFDKLFTKMEELTGGRPTWAVTLILGSLLSLCTGLIVFVLNVAH